MAAEITRIEGLTECQPLFQEFCKVNGLKNGDFYRAVDYIFWADSLSLADMIETIRKYQPDFKMKGCNL